MPNIIKEGGSKMRSRIIAIILVISLVLPIVGCGSDENNSLVGEDKGDSSQVEKKGRSCPRPGRDCFS